MLAPIIILGFSRPDYLESVLRSLLSQEGGDLSSRPIAFFQDGAVSPLSNIRYSSDEDVAEAAAVFRKYFPNAPMFCSPKNLGICANFDRAEHYAFEDLDAEVAYFFEDDLVLSPHYLAAMDSIWNAVKDRDRIPYFAAYGDRFSNRDDQKLNASKAISMRHNWGFALKRNHWREMRIFLKPYYDIVLARDYHERDDDKIRQWYNSLGYAHEATSQDGAKALATNLLGRWRLLTTPCFANYIGKVGTHTDPAHFDRAEFGSTQVYEGVLEGIDIPSEAVLDKAIQAERDLYRIWRDRFQSNEVKITKSSRSDVMAAYRLFLGRLPESDAVMQQWAGMPIDELVNSFIKSYEYRVRVGLTKKT
jgi:hypothetical protein